MDKNYILNDITQIWKDILGIDEADVDESIFVLGGDSISIVTAVTAIQEKFGVVIDMTEMYEYDTLRGLAELVFSQIEDRLE